jgi:hypothetical protein
MSLVIDATASVMILRCSSGTPVATHSPTKIKSDGVRPDDLGGQEHQISSSLVQRPIHRYSSVLLKCSRTSR